MLKQRKAFRLWTWLKILPRNAFVLYYAWRHPLTPRYVKGVLAVLLLYLVSPIDLVPDYLPLVGIIDDATLASGVMLYLVRLLPPAVLTESQYQSEKWNRRLPYVLGLIGIAAVAWIVFVIAIFRKVFFE